MKKNNIGYLLREGVRGVFVNGFMSFAAVCVTVACLIIMGSFLLILFNLNEMIVDLEQENEMLVYIDESYSEAKAKSVGSQLNLISNVREAKYVSRDEALDSFVAEMDSSAMFNGLDASTFRDRYVVTLEDNSLMKETEAQIRAVDGVSDVNAPYEIINGFQTVQKVLNIASAVIIAVLFVVSLLIISNTVKLAMYSRSEEIAIMKMVGATNSFIRMPFVVEGFILGFLGALIAFFLQWGLYDFVAMKVAEIDSLQLITVAPFLDVIEPVALIYALTGFVVGVFGSLLSEVPAGVSGNGATIWRNPMKSRNKFTRIVCVALAVIMLVSLVSTALIMLVNAASSKEIEKELVDLRAQQAELKKQSDALKAEINQNEAETQTLIEKKADIDKQMDMSRQTIENLNAQIQQYSLLIADKQSELEDSLAEEAALNEQYKARLRTMEETGKISYWSILFGARSFSDLLDKIDMIQEIAKADQLMMEKLKAMSEKIAGERADLETQMDDLNAAKDELAVQQAELETQRAESDELLIQMAKEYESMSAEYADYEAMEDELSAQIAKSETDYFNALSREEAARIAAAAKNNTGSSSASGSSGSASASGFVFPMAYATKITDAYGYRIHPLSGTKKWHNGVDFAAGEGTAIYATKAGTVTSATYNEAYGYMVTINHGDGYSSLYGHMTNYIVSVGDTVSAGQTIGYVGSTGWSTGPHLHFTIYYNGSDVNPLNYVSMP